MSQPQIIVITPVRNEAWVLEAFLAHCSSWANRIIIADQHSTDGSREIAAQFPKVTLIDNPQKEMHQATVRYHLFKEVDQIAGDKIVFALDADEFLSEGFIHTNGWKKILNSHPNSIFCFRWQNLISDFCHEECSPLEPAEWACHFDSKTRISELYAQAEQKAIHEARVPCTSDAQYIEINDIRYIHLARINNIRTRNKNDFYQVSTINKLRKSISSITLYRTYHPIPNIQNLVQDISLTTSDGTQRLNSLVHTNDHGWHYINEISAILQREGTRKYRMLCIWDNPDLKSVGIDYRPPILIRILHHYLKHTQSHTRSTLIRFIDWLLKKIL